MKKLLKFFVGFAFVLTLLIGGTSVFAAQKQAQVINSSGKVVQSFDFDTNKASAGIQQACYYIRDLKSKSIFTIKIPAGTYIVEQGIKLYSNTTLDLTGVTLKRVSDAGALIRFGRTDETGSGYSTYQNIKITASGDRAVLDGGQLQTATLKFAHAQNIIVENMSFTNGKNCHYVEFAGCNNVTIDNCKFSDFVFTNDTNFEALQMDILNEARFSIPGKYDGTINKNITVSNCVFDGLSRGVGTHSAEVGKYFDNIKITGNTFSNIKGYAVLASNYINSDISGNTITNCGTGIFVRNMVPTYINTFPTGKLPIQDLNITVNNNNISLSSEEFEGVQYGVHIYGEYLTSDKHVVDAETGEKLTIPKGDYRIKNVTISGNTITSKTTFNGVWLEETSDSSVLGNTITNHASSVASEATDGIKIETNSKNNVISNNIVTDANKKKIIRNGVYVKDGSTGNTVSGNNISYTKEDGVYASGVSNTEITGNTLKENAKYGVFVDRQAGTSSSTASQIKNNKIYNPGIRGIGANTGSYAVISGNTINNAKTEGIFAGGKSVVSLYKNTIINSGTQGVYINGSNASMINNNNIKNSKQNSIIINTGSSVTKIQNNVLTDSAKYGITLIDSEASIISNNKIVKSANKYAATRAINLGGSKTSVTQLSNNTIDTVSAEGIYIFTSAKVGKLTGNKIVDVLGHGIYVNLGTVTSIKQNTITKSKAKYASNRGICIATAKTKVTEVYGNNISNTKAEGIMVSAKAYVGKIQANKVANTKSYGIYVSDGSTVKNITSNSVTAASVYGIYVRRGIKTLLVKNSVVKTKQPMCVQTTKNIVVNTVAPKITKIAVGTKKLTVSWTKVTGATEYIVYRSTSLKGKYTKLGSVKKNVYVDKTVKKGQTYFYKIVAYSNFKDVKVTGITSSAVGKKSTK